MRFPNVFAAATLFVTLAGIGHAQERFESGWLKGFTKSPTEHIIDEPDKPFAVRSVKGIVLDPSGAEMDGVVVELRNEMGQIRGTKTNGKGAFKLKGVPEGTYKFKVTMNGFQSIVGDIVVSKKAKDADLAKVVMKVGNLSMSDMEIYHQRSNFRDENDCSAVFNLRCNAILLRLEFCQSYRGGMSFGSVLILKQVDD